MNKDIERHNLWVVQVEQLLGKYQMTGTAHREKLCQPLKNCKKNRIKHTQRTTPFLLFNNSVLNTGHKAAGT
jgi:hypothetical protein